MAFGIDRSCLSAAVIVVIVWFLTGAAAISAQDGGSQAAGNGPLDGMVFVGRIGPEKNPDFDEELHFNNGQFWSKNCILCGYQPSYYWIRITDDGIHFQGDLLKKDGSKFSYTGRVSDGRIKVTVRWTKSRWYWSIDQTLVFNGVRDKTKTAVSVDEASRLANAARLLSLPMWCT
jgi:hypothetical protein